VLATGGRFCNVIHRQCVTYARDSHDPNLTKFKNHGQTTGKTKPNHPKLNPTVVKPKHAHLRLGCDDHPYLRPGLAAHFRRRRQRRCTPAPSHTRRISTGTHTSTVNTTSNRSGSKSSARRRTTDTRSRRISMFVYYQLDR
jgi:hypothetical protein